MSYTLRYFFPFCLVVLCATQLIAQESPTDYHQYLEDRDSLLKLDSVLYFDAAVILSPEEKLLNDLLIKLKQDMLANGFVA